MSVNLDRRCAKSVIDGDDSNACFTSTGILNFMASAKFGPNLMQYDSSADMNSSLFIWMLCAILSRICLKNLKAANMLNSMAPSTPSASLSGMECVISVNEVCPILLIGNVWKNVGIPDDPASSITNFLVICTTSCNCPIVRLAGTIIRT